MKITLEMIDELRSRVNVTYEEAKDALERTEGDVVKSIILLERQKKGYKDNNKQSKKAKANTGANKALNTFLSTDFVLKRKDKIFLNIPLWIVMLVGLFTMPFSIILLVVLLLVGYQMRIVTGKKTKFDINKNVDKMTKKFKETTDKIFEETEERKAARDLEEEDSEDDTNEEDEITIE